MLRVTVDINGKKISQVAAVRQEKEKQGKNNYKIYDYSGVSPKSSVVEDGVYLFSIEHIYGDGALVLISKIIDELEGLP